MTQRIYISEATDFILESLSRLFPKIQINIQGFKQPIENQHLIHISSAGAHIGLGQYLFQKKQSERLIINSNSNFTVLRPGPLAGNKFQPERSSYENLSAFFNGLASTLIGEFFYSLRPMDVDILARIIVYVSQNPNQFKNRRVGKRAKKVGNQFPTQLQLNCFCN